MSNGSNIIVSLSDTFKLLNFLDLLLYFLILSKLLLTSGLFFSVSFSLKRKFLFLMQDSTSKCCARKYQDCRVLRINDCLTSDIRAYACPTTFTQVFAELCATGLSTNINQTEK